MDWGTVALSLAAALLGTYLGARVMVFYQDRKVQKIRNIAIKALCIILEFRGFNFKVQHPLFDY